MGVAADPEPQTPPPAPALPPRIGEVLYIDYQQMDEGGESLWRTVEATILPVGGGLLVSDTVGTRARATIRSVYAFLHAHLSALGLPATWLQERKVAIDIPGDPLGDGSGVALAAFLAMLSAIRKDSWPVPVIAIGESTLHGRLTSPHHLEDRLKLVEDRPVRIVLPADAAEGLETTAQAHWEVSFIPDLETVVRRPQWSGPK